MALLCMCLLNTLSLDVECILLSSTRHMLERLPTACIFSLLVKDNPEEVIDVGLSVNTTVFVLMPCKDSKKLKTCLSHPEARITVNTRKSRIKFPVKLTPAITGEKARSGFESSAGGTMVDGNVRFVKHSDVLHYQPLLKLQL